MKELGFLIAFCIFFIGCKPNRLKDFSKITDSKSAQHFLKENTDIEGEFLSIESAKDSSSISKLLFKSNRASVVTTDNYYYKIIDSISTPIYRCSYIFFDGKIYSKKSIDSLRNVALGKLNENAPFPTVAAEYTMDKNPVGDTHWFKQGDMEPEFSDAVKQHALNDLFVLDIPEKYMHFIVRKTYTNNRNTKLVLLKIKKQQL